MDETQAMSSVFHYLIVQWETVGDIQDPTTLTIAFNAVCCLFVTHLPLQQYLPSFALRQSELLPIYSMLIEAMGELWKNKFIPVSCYRPH